MAASLFIGRQHAWLFVGRENAAGDLILFDGFEQGAEIALAEPLIALALNDLEEDGADDGLGKDLQQQPAAWRAIEKNAARLHARHILAMPAETLFQIV